MATHQIGRCFEEIDIFLEDMHAAPSTAAMMAETASPAMDALADTMTSWFCCPHANNLRHGAPLALLQFPVEDDPLLLRGLSE